MIQHEIILHHDKLLTPTLIFKVAVDEKGRISMALLERDQNNLNPGTNWKTIRIDHAEAMRDVLNLVAQEAARQAGRT